MPETTDRTAFRLPRTTYLVVVFLAVGVWPLALSGGDGGGGSARPAELSGLVLLFLLPFVAAAFIARTGTDVDAEGITVRAMFGRRSMAWAQIRGVSVQGSKVFAVQADGTVRLPCVQISHLAELARASHGYLPDLPPPRVKQPPARRRR